MLQQLRWIVCFFVFIYYQHPFAATLQILNNLFFPNPAELNLVKDTQAITGTAFVTPTFQFNGTYAGNQGGATSKVHNQLPYTLISHRWSDRWVLGINATPSTYGHLSWPTDSVLATSGTTTKFIYYRFGAQSSYQFTDNLFLGAGANLEYNRILELDFLIPNYGNQINKAADRLPIFDFGLFYKINAKNNFTLAAFSGLNTYAKGSSSLGNLIVNNYEFRLLDAPVVYIGLQQLPSDKWFVEEKLYWSGWSIVKNIIFLNTVTGNYLIPVHWRDVWTYQMSTRYATTEHIAMLASFYFDTNAVPIHSNQIGYPVSSVAAVSGGFDFTLNQFFSLQLLYAYGAYVPNATINNNNGNGKINANFQTAIAQLTYKM